MKIIKILLFFVFLIGCASNSEHSKEMVARLKSEGKSYYDQLISTQEYDNFLDRIEGGDDILIRAAYLLTPWVDASTSISLNYSLSRALTKKPSAVMSLVPKYFSVTDICTIPYIEETADIELDHVKSSIKALEKILNKSSASSYVECINIYNNFKKDITMRSKRTP